MCGFAAYFDPDGRTPELDWLAGAADALAHRGPDDAGFHVEPGLGLAPAAALPEVLGPYPERYGERRVNRGMPRLG